MLLTHLKRIFPYIDGFQIKKESEEEPQEKKSEKIKDDFEKFIEYIDNESKGINYNLFKNYFNFVVHSALAKKIYETKNKKKKLRGSERNQEQMEQFKR